MLSQSQVAQFLVHMVVANDGDLLDTDELLTPQICAEHDRNLVRQLRDIIHVLYRGYEYSASPEFAATTEGKSDAYRNMLRKIWSAAEKRTQKRREYAAALGTLLADDRAYQMTAPAERDLLDRLKNGLLALDNPRDPVRL